MIGSGTIDVGSGSDGRHYQADTDRDRQRQTETDRQRRLHQIPRLATAASDSRGSSGLRLWIGSESTDGGSVGDGRWRQTETG